MRAKSSNKFEIVGGEKVSKVFCFHFFHVFSCFFVFFCVFCVFCVCLFDLRFPCWMLTIPAVVFNWTTLCTRMPITENRGGTQPETWAWLWARSAERGRVNLWMRGFICLHMCVRVCVCVCECSSCRHFAVGRTWCCNLHKIFHWAFLTIQTHERLHIHTHIRS